MSRLSIDHGKLDQRITLQQRVVNRLPSGEEKYTFANVATNPEVWAEANPVRGREFIAAAQVQADKPMAFRILWRDDIDSTMRVLWRGEPYDIAAEPMDTRGAREELWLHCVGGVRDGR
jgi:SPP1 family predicted phage head-tail adaptor